MRMSLSIPLTLIALAMPAAAQNQPATAPATAASAPAVPEELRTLITKSIALLEAEKFDELIDLIAPPSVVKEKGKQALIDRIKPAAPELLKSLKAAQTGVPARATSDSITFEPGSDVRAATFHKIDGRWYLK